MMRSVVESIDGFGDPVEYHTSVPTVLTVNIALLAILAELFFPGVVAAFIESVPFSTAELFRFVESNPVRIAGFVVFSVVLVVMHELVHVAAHKANGFDISYGVTWFWTWKIPNPIPYVVVFDDPLTRSENIMGLLAPLVVLTAIGLVGLLPVFPAIVTYCAKVLLVVNTAGSSGDIYNSVKVGRHAPGTLFLNVKSDSGIRTFTYAPAG